MIKIILYILLSLKLFAFECLIDQRILNVISWCEKSAYRNVGYEYLISFNNYSEQKEVIDDLKDIIKINEREIDCKNKDNCIENLQIIINKNIENIDLGAFGINYKFNKKNNLGEYFDYKESYKLACNINQANIKRFGYSWETIARYHSSTKEHNYNYLRKIENILISKKDIW